MVIKIEELSEATDGQVPIFVKLGASRTFDDVKLAAKAGADVVVVDGMEGGTGASPAILQEHTGIPTLAAVCEARAALEDCGLYGEVQLIIAGGIRDGVDAAKAMALGADAGLIGRAYLYGLMAAGEAGVDRALELLADQFTRTMQLLGVTSIPELRKNGDELISRVSRA